MVNDTSIDSNSSTEDTMATFHGSRSASHIGRKPAFGQSCSMRTLLQDGILQAGEKVLTLECEGNKFYGDLRRDGTIMMRDPGDAPHIYATPVAWANHCCKMLNPESKPLNAWSSIRFKGKRLDSYKLKWYRAQKRPNNNNNSNNSNLNISNNSNINNQQATIPTILAGIQANLRDAASNSNAMHSNLAQLPNAQGDGGGSRLMIHNQITNYFPQYENPIRNKKLIKSLLISNNMDNDCKRLVAKSLDQSVDPVDFCRAYNQPSPTVRDAATNDNNDDTLNNNNKTNNNNDDSSTDNNVAQSENNKEATNGDNVNPEDEVATTNNIEDNNDETSARVKSCKTIRTTVINYEQLGTRGPHNTHDLNTMVKCIPFSTVDRIQPFSVTISTNALLLVDFHSHLVSGEVAGYLAGSWDFGQHTLTVTQAFPCRTALDDETSAASVEDEIRQDIEKRNLTVVGWYHSHQGKYSNHPTIRDIQSQLEHQIAMKESSVGYVPCIGLICSPHDTRTDDDLSPSFQVYWVMPPPEHLANHYGRPMQMYYSVTRDLFLTQDLLLEMRLLANYYTKERVSELVDFKAEYPNVKDATYLDKLSESIRPKLPKDLQESEYPDEPAIWRAAVDHFWTFLRNLVTAVPEQPSSQDSQPDESQGRCDEILDQPEEVVAEDEDQAFEQASADPMSEDLSSQKDMVIDEDDEEEAVPS